jgi:hypothetical protein
MHPQSTDQIRALNLFTGVEHFVHFDLSISGLDEGTLPSEPWKVLDCFTRKEEDDREFFLVENQETKQTVLLRICDAFPGSGYAKFCRVHEVSAPNNTEAADTFYRWKGTAK